MKSASETNPKETKLRKPQYNEAHKKHTFSFIFSSFAIRRDTRVVCASRAFSKSTKSDRLRLSLPIVLLLPSPYPIKTANSLFNYTLISTSFGLLLILARYSTFFHTPTCLNVFHCERYALRRQSFLVHVHFRREVDDLIPSSTTVVIHLRFRRLQLNKVQWSDRHTFPDWFDRDHSTFMWSGYCITLINSRLSIVTTKSTLAAFESPKWACFFNIGEWLWTVHTKSIDHEPFHETRAICVLLRRF
jgi:hypothetical protein